MSHYGGAGQFEDAEGSIERRIQEELRARQANSAAAASRITGALGAHPGFSGTAAERAAFMNSLIAESAAANNPNSPYFAQRAAAVAAGAHSPFARPYGALGQPGASPGYGHSPADAVASLYARQRAQYGYGNPGSPYGVPGAAHDLYAQHFGRPQDKMTMIDRAAAYNAQQRQAEQANALLQPPNQSPAFGQTPATTPSATTPRSAPRPASKSSTPGSASPQKPRPRKESSSPTKTPPSNSKDKQKSSPKSAEKEDVVDGDGQRWFVGSVPLGLEDDKYWLSELQVFLRANFAEAFGATEEDIAAPMHGRNKPIALGQVGIRCMHCKRTYRSDFSSVCSIFH